MKKERKNQYRTSFAGYGLLLALCLIIIIVSLRTDSFLTLDNIVNIMRQVAHTGIMALGVAVVIIAGHMDLSISSTVTMTGVVCVSYIKYMQADMLESYLGF